MPKILYLWYVCVYMRDQNSHLEQRRSGLSNVAIWPLCWPGRYVSVTLTYSSNSLGGNRKSGLLFSPSFTFFTLREGAEVCTQAACHPLQMAHLFKERVRTATQCARSPHASKWPPTTSAPAKRCCTHWNVSSAVFSASHTVIFLISPPHFQQHVPERRPVWHLHVCLSVLSVTVSAAVS